MSDTYGDTCPVCGTVLIKRDILVDLETNSLVGRGRVIRLRPGVAEFLAVLAATYPAVVTFEVFARALWGRTGWPRTAMQILQARMSAARHQLAEVGHGVEASSPPGTWRLVPRVTRAWGDGRLTGDAQ